jgi:hypothetical protein
LLTTVTRAAGRRARASAIAGSASPYTSAVSIRSMLPSSAATIRSALGARSVPIPIVGTRGVSSIPMRLAIAALLLIAGCNLYRRDADDDSADDDAAPDASVDGSGEICDCWPMLACNAMVVYEWGGFGPEDPDACEQSCLIDSYPCTNGCDVEGATFYEWDFAPEALCAGTPDAVVGDACTSVCIPTHGTYLACDPSTHQCVATSAPVVEDWLAPCVDVPAPPQPGFVGVDALHSCLMQDVPAASCFATAHSIQCNGDWECPEGATCDDDLPGGGGAWCRPGARGTPLDLGC